MQRWFQPGCFEAIVHDLRALLRLAEGQKAADVALEQGIKLEVVKLPETKRGFVLLPRR